MIEEIQKPPGVRDITGRQFGHWHVLGYHGRKTYKGQGSFADYWKVKCSCGRESLVQGRSLVAETSRRCMDCSGFKSKSLK